MIAEGVDVLLVEDHPLEIELLLRALAELQSDPLMGPVAAGVARDGEEALDYLLARGPYRRRAGPLPRVVLLSLKLPRMDGLEVLRALRGSPRTAALPIVVLTPTTDTREIAQSYQLGANSCVCKPVDYAAFRSTIRALGRYWLGVNQFSTGPVLPTG